VFLAMEKHRELLNDKLNELKKFYRRVHTISRWANREVGAETYFKYLRRVFLLLKKETWLLKSLLKLFRNLVVLQGDHKVQFSEILCLRIKKINNTIRLWTPIHLANLRTLSYCQAIMESQFKLTGHTVTSSKNSWFPKIIKKLQSQTAELKPHSTKKVKAFLMLTRFQTS